MRIGIELADERRRPRPSAIAGMARAAERLGYATVWVRDGGAPAETVDLLAVAAGATDVVGLGVEALAVPPGAIVAHLEEHGALLAERLHLAVPTEITTAEVDRLRTFAPTATVLLDLQLDLCAVAGDVDGYFVDEPSRATRASSSVGLDVVVRLPVLGDAADRAIEQLHHMRAVGADEVVLAAVEESDLDRAMATYAALAEVVERATS